MKIDSVDLFWLHVEFTCVTRTSKNAVSARDQKLPAFIVRIVSKNNRRAIKISQRLYQESPSLSFMALGYTHQLSKNNGIMVNSL